MKESSFEGVGGLKIATKSWESNGKARGIMILIHGFNAHSGYMEWPGEQFSASGLATFALDLRGRGKSEGERFYVEELSDYLTDIDTLVNITAYLVTIWKKSNWPFRTPGFTNSSFDWRDAGFADIR